MIRKVLEFSSRHHSRRLTGQFFPRQRKPAHLSSRKEFSTATPLNGSPKPGTPSKPPESGNSFPKVVIGGVAVGAAVFAAHQAGYLDQFLYKEKQSSQAKVDLDDEGRFARVEAKPFSHVEENVPPSVDLHEEVSPSSEDLEEKGESHLIASTPEALTEKQDGTQPQPHDKSETPSGEERVLDQEKSTASGIISDDLGTSSGASAEESLDREIPNAGISVKPSEEGRVSHASTPISVSVQPTEDIEVESPVPHIIEEDRKEDSQDALETATPLLDAYHLVDKDNGISPVYLNGHGETEAFVSAMEELGERAASKDGKVILDFLQAIHAAELRQAELDAHAFAEEKKAMKEKYEKELKDAIARELMHAEEAALLDKELKRERVKAAAAIKSLQQKLEEKYKTELEEKEKEAELRLTKVEELSKAEISAAIAREKASQIEKMAEANLHINALCMAFYARSEEARQSHSIHKLALGAVALEDALSKGLPIKAEIEALRAYLHGIDKDSVLDVVLSSLPEETIDHGTDSVLKLNQQFDTIKGTLRHFSLIPPGGGGILAHSLARIASWLKVREANNSGDGIEAVITRVESYLAEGKLAEAADALEEGVKDSQASEIIGSWVKQARNRAIAEQALTLIQSYATSVSLK